MLASIFITFSIVTQLAAAPADAQEKIVVQASNGRFVRDVGDGFLRADSCLPPEKDLFHLVELGKDKIILQGHSSRSLQPDSRDPHTLRLGATGKAIADNEPCFVLTAPDNRFTLQSRAWRIAPSFVPADPHGAKPQAAGELLQIYREKELPEFLETAVSVTVQAIVAKELVGKEYDQTRTQEIKKYIDMPEPTFKVPKRTKKVQVLASTEEYRVQAHLDGEAEVHIPTMMYLKNYADGGPGMMLIAINAKLPITGHVSCKIPNIVTASTGYRATIELSAVVAIGVQHAYHDISFAPYTVTDLHVAFAQLDLSNNLLEVARSPIKHFINHELERNQDRLRDNANRSLEKAMLSRAVRLPLLGYLGL